jgi:ribosomal protein L37E
MASDGDVREASEAKRTLILGERSERRISAWSVAARFTSVGDAASARSALDVAGIDTYLADAPDTLGVMVHEDDVDRARDVIRASALRTRDEIEVSTCAECGSPDLRPIPRVRTLLLLSAILAGIGFAIGQMTFAAICLIAVIAGVAMMPTHRCANCGWTSTPFAASSRRAPLPDRPDLVERPCPRCGSLMQRRHCESCGFTSR